MPARLDVLLLKASGDIVAEVAEVTNKSWWLLGIALDPESME